MTTRKPRPTEWRRRFDASTGGPLHELALLANKPNDQQAKDLRWKLIKKGEFNSTLDKLIEAGATTELTDEERAYCEGWAMYARQQLDPTKPADDEKLVDAINDAIKGHSGSFDGLSEGIEKLSG